MKTMSTFRKSVRALLCLGIGFFASALWGDADVVGFWGFKEGNVGDNGGSLARYESNLSDGAWHHLAIVLMLENFDQVTRPQTARIWYNMRDAIDQQGQL